MVNKLYLLINDLMIKKKVREIQSQIMANYYIF